MKLVIASRNMKKVDELKRILGELNLTLLSINDFPNLGEVEEDGETFEENALKKARYVCKETGLPALSDDSGLEVEALKGRPGVRSAIYAGENATDEENVRKLLEEMRHIPTDRRKARFVCCIALVFPNGEERVFYGYVNGRIIDEPRGNFGFGYDPVFVPEGYSKTFAEMTAQEKDSISHRREALDKVKNFLIKFVNLSFAL